MKKGVSQLDWIISLALFLLYMVWFFLFVTPSITYGSNRDTMMVWVQHNFNDEFEWKLDKFPLFIQSNTVKQLPVIIDFSRPNIRFFDDRSFIYWNNKLIFLANITSVIETVWIVEGNGNSDAKYSDLIVEKDWASTENFSAYFDNSLLNKARYKENEIVKKIIYNINTVELIPSEVYYKDVGFAGMYEASTGNINHTSFLFAKNSEIHNFLSAPADYYLTLNLELINFDSYYSNNIYYGDFNYKNETQSVAYYADNVTLSGLSDFTLIFSSSVQFNFTYYNTTLNLGISKQVTDDYEYKYFFHEGTLASYTTQVGAIETLHGINLNNISANYTYLKNKFNYPSSRNFNIRVFTNTSAHLQELLYEVGPEAPGGRNVHAETEDLFALNEDGTYSPITVNYRLW